jgi:putative colanic acid biosynthesis UDP-glucose lipid carrier transferase
LQTQKKHNQNYSNNSALKVVFRQNARMSDTTINISFYSYFFKRFFDFSIALIAVLLISPILMLLYLITKYTSKGPGLYHQKRVGINGKEFYIFKFRSMIVNSEFDTPQLVSNTKDSRVTPWGRFMRKHYLDELPQLLNVLRGDMSIVGPRPERRYFINKIIERGGNFNSLLQVKPGITSLGQIRFGYAHSVDEMLQRLKYEQLYLTRISLWTDIKIMINTTMSVVKAKGK